MDQISIASVVAKAAEVAALKAKAERTRKDIATLEKRATKEEAAANQAKNEYDVMETQANAAMAGKPNPAPSKK